MSISKYSKICMILLLTASMQTILASEERLIPVSYEVCGEASKTDSSASMLWDNLLDQNHKWCCFHAGYYTEQSHWIAMDFGKTCPITKIEIIHDGESIGERHLRTEDFAFYGSNSSIKRDWQLIQDVKDNTEFKNTFTFSNPASYRYIKLEITDPQLSSGANMKQDDWAVRIRELYIYTGDGAEAQTATVQNPVPTTALSSNPLYTIYYFYNPYVDKCKIVQSYFMSMELKPLLDQFKVININANSNMSQAQQYRIFKVPTIIIFDSMGKEMKRTSNIDNEESFKKFLEIQK